MLYKVVAAALVVAQASAFSISMSADNSWRRSYSGRSTDILTAPAPAPAAAPAAAAAAPASAGGMTIPQACQFMGERAPLLHCSTRTLHAPPDPHPIETSAPPPQAMRAWPASRRRPRRASSTRWASTATSSAAPSAAATPTASARCRATREQQPRVGWWVAVAQGRRRAVLRGERGLPGRGGAGRGRGACRPMQNSLRAGDMAYSLGRVSRSAAPSAHVQPCAVTL